MEVPPEVHFAQQLASNQPKIREKALKKLGKWLEVTSVSVDAFTEDGFLKLWKGIFYYFWNCDKPLVQEDRADVLSKYVHVFKTVENSFLYIDTFFQTMAREWSSIDRYRIEKFMMLVRRFLHQSFELLKRLKWELKWIKFLRKVMKKTIINPFPESAPLGLKIHISDIYMEELAKVGSEELTPELIQKFLIPFCHVLIKCDELSYVSCVSKDVFLYLINQDADEEQFHQFPILKFDVTAVQKLLLKYANKSYVRRKQMKIIYEIVKEFEDYKSGLCAADKIFMDHSAGPKLRKRAVEKAALELFKEEVEFAEEKSKVKRKKHKQQTDAADL